VRKKVLEVRDVELTVHEDGRLDVRVRGSVPSLGWKAPELVPYSTALVPRDGIYDLDFLAEAPDCGSASVIDLLVAELSMKLPVAAKGLRVHASINSMIGILAEARAPHEPHREATRRAHP